MAESISLETTEPQSIDDRRREPRTAPPGEGRSVILEAGWGRREGVLWDVSASGAKLHFRDGDYVRDEDALSRALESQVTVRLIIEGESDPRRVRIAWHGLSQIGGYAIGVRLASSDSTQFEIGEDPAPAMPLLWVVFGGGGPISWLRRKG